MKKIITISDTHILQTKMVHSIPDGDILIHAGDFMNTGWSKLEYIPFLNWFASLPHKHKILIPGNHDRYVEHNREEFENDIKEVGDNIHYLHDSEIKIEGLKFYGSGWTPWFYDWAFNFPREPKQYEFVAKKTWNLIPDDVDILITHGNPYGINDKTQEGDLTGCKYLSERILKLKNLKLYIGGHIHESYGITKVNNIPFVNASICTRNYSPNNAPIEIVL